MHLHGVTYIYIPAQIFITYGLVADQYTNWIKFALTDTFYPALIGGFSFGECCQSQSTYFSITTELTQNSGIVLLVIIISLLLYFGLLAFHRFCLKIENALKNIRYFVFSIFIALLFSFVYSSANSLYHYVLLTPVDTFNTALGVILGLILLCFIVSIWVVTINTVINTQKNNNPKIHDISKDIVFEHPPES